MEKWFARQLFTPKLAQGEYAGELQEWLKKHEQDLWIKKLHKREKLFKYVLAFSLLTGVFMGLGTTYLLTEAFAVIPLMAIISGPMLPFVIAPMAIVAGAAYALLSYNAVTDMIQQDTLSKWYYKIRDAWQNGSKLKASLLSLATFGLVALAIALTLCTAGTWWTVTKEARPLFAWMAKLPSFIMGIINPIINGFSAIIFNLQNTSESLEMVEEALEPTTDKKESRLKSVRRFISSLIEKENVLQLFNVPRIILKLTLTLCVFYFSLAT